MSDDTPLDLLDEAAITGYLDVELPGKTGSTTLAWAKPWPPPRLLAVVITQAGRFPVAVMALDATDWIDGTTMVPNADVAYFYVLAMLTEPITVKVQDIATSESRTKVIDIATAKYKRVLGVTVGSPS